MFDYLYEWLRNLAFYLILMTAVMHTLPSSVYKKYVRFFTGLVLILMLLTPVFNLLRIEYEVPEIYEEYEFQKDLNEIEIEEIVIGP